MPKFYIVNTKYYARDFYYEVEATNEADAVAMVVAGHACHYAESGITEEYDANITDVDELPE